MEAYRRWAIEKQFTESTKLKEEHSYAKDPEMKPDAETAGLEMEIPEVLAEEISR